MIKMGRKVLMITFVTAIFFDGSSIEAAANTPTEAIRSTVDAVISLIKDNNISKSDNKQIRREKIRSMIGERFDFEEMSQRSLARHWAPRTPAEKKEFVNIFSDLLESSYISKIELYTDEKITYDKEILKGNNKYGVVSTTVVTKNVNIPIDYKLILKGDKWWVYDVTIEGVSFISTYREQYNKIIVKESYASLLNKMKSKLDEINALEQKETSAGN